MMVVLGRPSTLMAMDLQHTVQHGSDLDLVEDHTMTRTNKKILKKLQGTLIVVLNHTENNITLIKIEEVLM